ncbi:unnamed protein product [Medioppia subpectinata]|uniref:GH18 domain-containing protein n=1 Tax=Medioppia subpectinata TaxID=1979941 RepID=A0A7R9Q113_9ACAR|nr:unnamed protein product [Medioppia subpectinata]CAG2107848.1 unnamed protein product [Medioppia subpectinata]
MMKACLAVCMLLVCLGQLHAEPKILCYYESWFAYPSHGAGAMQVKQFDNTLCTHRIYGYNGVSSSAEVLISDPWLETSTTYHQLYDWGHDKGSDLSLMGIGGFNFALNLTYAAQNPTIFTTSLVNHLKTYALDGAVIEWSSNHWKYEYMADYVTLLKHLKEAFAPNKWVLGTVLAADQPGYDIKSVAEQVDLIIIQSFDYHGSWNTEVGHSSAIEDQKISVNRWVENGATKEKTIVTVPAYGHTWTLTDTTKTDPGSPAKGAGTKGPFTDSPGKLGVNELMLRLKDDPTGWTRKEDGALGAAYYYKGDQWVSIEDTKTAEAKGAWVKSAGLGGIAVQAINNDDFNGLASTTKFPLTQAIKKGYA